MVGNPHQLVDGDMLLLLALEVGNAIHVNGGEMRLPDPARPGESMPVPAGALDRLEGSGLVAIEESGAVPTDKGRYWLKKWMVRHLGRGRFVKAR